MHSKFWTAVGVLLTVAMIILSAFINYSFGHSLGTTETNARIFAGVSAVPATIAHRGSGPMELRCNALFDRVANPWRQ